ncbi:MAG TPA: hypothetical protein VFX98_13885 [Longimicrobiaceae bacterium]|nr:hypothetical protein [Longimicrobiaceae bacterium]
MAESESTALEHLEHAARLVWDAVQLFEEAQRVLFKAGDRYVAEVWGDGVRSVLEVTERMADLSGDLTAAHIDIGRLARRDRAR